MKLSTDARPWQQQFDERFVGIEFGTNAETLKSFISELLEMERKHEQVKMAIRMSNLEQRATAAKSDDRQRILGIIEGKKIIDDPAGILGDTGIVKAWNRRIDEIREKISTGSPPNDQLREKINEN